MRPRSLAPGVATALLLLPALLALHADAAPTTRVLTIDSASAKQATPFAAFDADPVKVFDFDGDGNLEIIDQNDNQHIYVFDSRTGALRADLTTSFPPGWQARSINGPEAAYLAPGGAPHLIAANSASVITDFRFDGIAGDGRFLFTKVWDRRPNDCFANPGMDAKPVLADLDGDGVLEILVQTEETGVYALRSDGSQMWKQCIGGGNGEPAVADLNFDGIPEAIFASDGGVVSVLNGRTGGFLWTYNALRHFNLGSASFPVGPAIGQLDGRGPLDILVGGRDSHDGNNWSNDHAILLALSGNGSLLWARQDAEAAPLTYTHPIIADVEGDGIADVFWGDWNTIGHKPPWNESWAWNSTGPAHVYRYDGAGNLIWRTTLNTFWSNKDFILADVDGDGAQEIVANGPSATGHDGLWYLDTATGAKKAFVDAWPWKAQRGPVAEDLWHTGTTQIVFPVSAYGSGTVGGAIQVYDTGSPHRALWPHPEYVSAPANGTPPPPPPPTNFSATFKLGNVNEWWVETTVTANRAITGVAAQVDDGAWMNLTLQSWGAWARSFYVPNGSRVIFRATDPNGGQSLSSTFCWLQPSCGGTPPPPPPPPPGNFTASFKLGNVNNWWVETYASSAHTVVGVDARTNGGAWIPLAKQSWGSWAKSFRVESGATVEFRAHNGTDALAVSNGFVWP